MFSTVLQLNNMFYFPFRFSKAKWFYVCMYVCIYACIYLDFCNKRPSTWWYPEIIRSLFENKKRKACICSFLRVLARLSLAFHNISFKTKTETVANFERRVGGLLSCRAWKEKEVQVKGKEGQVYSLNVNKNLLVKLVATKFISLRRIEGNSVLLLHSNTRARFKWAERVN